MCICMNMNFLWRCCILCLNVDNLFESFPQAAYKYIYSLPVCWIHVWRNGAILAPSEIWSDPLVHTYQCDWTAVMLTLPNTITYTPYENTDKTSGISTKVFNINIFKIHIHIKYKYAAILYIYTCLYIFYIFIPNPYLYTYKYFIITYLDLMYKYNKISFTVKKQQL